MAEQPAVDYSQHPLVVQLDELRRIPETYGRDYAAGVARPTPGGAFGADGESYESYGNLITGGPDQNPLLSGRNKFWVYNEMRRSDPAVRSLLWMFKLPIRSAQWTFEAASEDPADELIADAARWQFGVDDEEGRLDVSWDESLQQALLFLDFGCMFEELVWGDVDTWTDANGVARLIRPLNRLAPRMPITIRELFDDQATGLLTWAVQDVAGARPIPGESLAWYVLDKEGRNWFGTSLLRPCYGPWRMKKQLMIAAGIAWDRQGAGVPKVRHPAGEANQKRAEQIGQNVRTHERAWIALEGPDLAHGGEWDVEIMNTGQIADPVSLLRHYDGQISMAGLQMFARLGTTETGSRAVGEVLGEPFYMAAEAIAGQVALQRQKRVVRRWVDENFGTDKDAPRLNVSKIMAKNVEKLAAAIYQLSQAGLNFTDVETQNNIRDALELPELPDDLAASIDALPDDVGVEVTPNLPGQPAAIESTPSPPPTTT